MESLKPKLLGIGLREMFNKLRQKRDARIEKKYLALKYKFDNGCSFGDRIFNKYIDLEIKYNEIQDRKRNGLNVVRFDDKTINN